MTVATIEKNQLAPYLEQYEQVTESLPGQQGELKQFRQQAIAQFLQMGFPTMSDEDWRFTQLRPMLSKSYQMSLSDSEADKTIDIDLATMQIDDLDSYQIVFVDGAIAWSKSSLPNMQGVNIQAISQMAQASPAKLYELLSQFETPVENGFVALNNATISQGVVIHLEEGVVLDKPLELLFLGGLENSWSQPRVIMKLSDNANLQVIERHASYHDACYVCNQVCEVEVGAKAVLDWTVLQQENAKHYHVTTSFIKQYDDSDVSTHTVSLGGAIIRNHLTVNQLGHNAHSQLNGVYATNGRQHVDNYTRVIHSVANGRSDELYKGVLDDRSHAVFHGRIKVAKDAQQIDSEQANHTLLLSRDAQIDTKPQLEIYADDVKCAHGATVGELDKTSLFYLQSRGLSKAQAQALLTFGFVNEVVERMENEAVSHYIAQKLQQQFLVNI